MSDNDNNNDNDFTFTADDCREVGGEVGCYDDGTCVCDMPGSYD